MRVSCTVPVQCCAILVWTKAFFPLTFFSKYMYNCCHEINFKCFKHKMNLKELSSFCCIYACFEQGSIKMCISLLVMEKMQEGLMQTCECEGLRCGERLLPVLKLWLCTFWGLFDACTFLLWWGERSESHCWISDICIACSIFNEYFAWYLLNLCTGLS